MHLRDMWAVDGLYYLGIEENWGTEAATEIDRKVWEIMGKIEARKIKKLFDIKDSNIASVMKALSYSGWALDLEDKDIIIKKDKVTNTKTMKMKRNFTKSYTNRLRFLSDGIFTVKIIKT